MLSFFSCTFLFPLLFRIFKEHFNNDYATTCLVHLAKKFVLHEEKTKRLGFKKTIYTLSDPEARTNLRKKLRNISYNFRQGNGNSVSVSLYFVVSFLFSF